jgi:hypothetical protein
MCRKQAARKVFVDNIEQFSIDPSEGFGDLKFGFSTDAVQSYLGIPDEAEFLDPETETAANWSYGRLKLDIGFLAPIIGPVCNQIAVTTFTTRHPSVTLWNNKIIGKSENKILALFRQRGLRHSADWSIDESDRSFGYKTFNLDTLGITLDFRHGFLRIVQCRSLKR